MAKSIKEEFLFVCQMDNDDIRIVKKRDVEQEIKFAEEADKEIDFKVIAKISTANLTVDFPASRIIWYENTERSKPFVDKVVMKIINFIF